MFNFATLGPLAISAILVGGILLTVVLLYLLLRDQEQSSIKAFDGTAFSTVEACKAYEALYERINVLYEEKVTKSSRIDRNLGLSTKFLSLLKNEGFNDAKALITYREDFQKLSQLLFEEIN